GKPDVTGGEVPQPTSSASPSPAAAVGRTQDAGAAQAGAETTHAPQAAARAAAEQAPATQAEDQDLSVNGRRPVVDRVVLASKGDSGWVKVGLRWPDGDVTEGAGTAGTSRESRARGATNALLSALEPVLQNMRAHIDIDQVVIHQLGSQDSVLVRAVFYDRGSPTPVVGSALVHDDVATAAVRALLQAVNRKLLTSHD
ncbi:MAG: hypothetical protein ACRDJ5_04655, partial [Actinomycetota bacterium]